ncbi:unnamed protein product [marine sediment metagenome]|uniref:Uncharacterized protein n=1 Tax=marine sediment metagenome TaxID=412755 RepID=X1AFQ2_9ZZZZ
MTRRKIYEHLIGTNVFGIRDGYNVLFYKAHNQVYILTVQHNDDELYKAFELILRSF